MLALDGSPTAVAELQRRRRTVAAGAGATGRPAPPGRARPVRRGGLHRPADVLRCRHGAAASGSPARSGRAGRGGGLNVLVEGAPRSWTCSTRPAGACWHRASWAAVHRLGRAAPCGARLSRTARAARRFRDAGGCEGRLSGPVGRDGESPASPGGLRAPAAAASAVAACARRDVGSLGRGGRRRGGRGRQRHRGQRGRGHHRLGGAHEAADEAAIHPWARRTRSSGWPARNSFASSVV